MITKFKIFENSNQGPQLGDYVAMKPTIGAKDFSNYLTLTIGKIIEIEKIINNPDEEEKYVYRYVIKFDKYFVREGDFAVNQGEYYKSL